MVSNDCGTCPECGGRPRQMSTERICEQCGLVLDDYRIDHGPEWRSFEGEPNRKRTGAPLTRSRHDRGLSTEIGYGTGSRITGRKRRQLARMRRQHNRARISSKAERNRIDGFTEIRRLVTRLSLPDVARDRACTLFKSAQSEDLLRGRSVEGFAAASVYATARTLSVARTIDEVAEYARADHRELKVAYDALNRELGLPVGPIDPGQYLPRFASLLDLDRRVETRAGEHVERLSVEGLLSGKNPSGVAAACLYVAANELDTSRSVTQSAVGDVAGVAPTTIRSTARLLQERESLRT